MPPRDGNRLAELWDDAMARTPVELVSPLERGEVVRRLKAAVDSEWVLLGGKPAVGRVGDETFRLRARIGYRNSFQTFVFGKLRQEGSGTRLSCRTGMHPLAAAFMIVWLGAVAAFALAGLIVIAQPESGVETGLLILAPVVMFAFCLALVGVGRWLARNERRRLIEFLERTVDAKTVR